MKTLLAVVAVGLLGLGSLPQSAEDLLGLADGIFQEVWTSEYTQEKHVILESRLREAIALYEEAISKDEANVHALTMLARCYYTLADVFLVEDEEKKAAYVAGQGYGERALRATPGFVEREEEDGFVAAVRACQDVGALYWTYANWARKDEYDKLGAIFRGDAPKLEALILRCAELDRGYLCAGPLRALGAFWGGLPRLPFGTYRQNLDRAHQYLSQAVELCPEYLENLRFMVEFYLEPKGEEEKAQALLERIVKAPLGDYPLYNSLTKLWAWRRLSG
ncbi:hypothetical protein H5T52_00705 [Candidatus Bipolaricaulota bacterium]|nr:hypothetical protein [Candidatus Bipolaricaulota bacterium]